MSSATYGSFAKDVANTTTMKKYRFVYLNSDGQVDLPDATSDSEVLAIIGTTDSEVTPGGDILVRPIGGGEALVTVAANQTVTKGDPIQLTGTAGCVITGATGWYVGVAGETATSGASELAIIKATLRNPYNVASGT